MNKKFLSMLTIVGLTVSTTLSLSLLTACDDDDDDPTEGVDTDDIDNSITSGDAIDLGLSVKWASVNVGATLPADYGDYYAWGEIETKSSYDEDNSLTYGDSSIEDISGNAEYDAATAICGDSWRMPTKAEFQELIDNCTWAKITKENSDGEEVNGYKVIGSNGNSIFLPFAGYCDGSSPYDVGTDGYYWSSTPNANDGDDAYFLSFGSGYQVVYSRNRCRGRSVRPVVSE